MEVIWHASKVTSKPKASNLYNVVKSFFLRSKSILKVRYTEDSTQTEANLLATV